MQSFLNSSLAYAADTGSANAYAISVSAMATIETGFLIEILAGNTNTGASTLSINTATPMAITKNGASALTGGEIAAGQMFIVIYDGTEWQLIASAAPSLTNPMTTEGDIIVGGASGTPTRLAAGTSGNVLQTNGSGSAPTWVPPGGGGGGGGALVLLAELTASSSASLAFTTRNASGQSGAMFQTDYDEYEIHILNLTPATNSVTIELNFSTNGGSTWDASAIYNSNDFEFVFNGTGTGGGGASQTFITLARTVDNDTNYVGLKGKLTLVNPAGTTYKSYYGQGMTWDSLGPRVLGWEWAGVYANATAANAFQVKASSGNLALGTIRVYGIAH